MLLQLTYISTARPTLILSDVEGILISSRRRNELAGVTGLLIFDSMRFLQVLEGDPAAVEATYGRICQDSRHRGLIKLSERSIAAHEFGSWSMASHIIGPVLGRGNLIEQVDAMTETLVDPNVRATLRGFARVRGAG